MKHVDITETNLKQICRYECGLDDIMGESVRANFTCKAHYMITASDVCTALTRVRDEKQTFEEFYYGWYELISDTFKDAVGFYKSMAARPVIVRDAEDISYIEYPEYTLTKNEKYVLAYVFEKIEEMCIGAGMEDVVSEIMDLDSCIDCIVYYLEDKEKSVWSRRYVDEVKTKYIVERENCYDEMSSAEFAAYKRFVEQLCKKDNVEALRIKGYATYGGNKLYECDWKKSRDCMLKLVDLTGDPYPANSLGYIYYYGRCSDGVPDYELAYKYFSMGAMGGIYESIYKIADMYIHGYYVHESLDRAENLCAFVYEENLKLIEKGRFDCKFADAALRMGDLAKLKGNDIYAIQEAYFYFIQAEYAINMRIKNADHYGDSIVKKRITEEKNNIESILEQAGIAINLQTFAMDYPWFFTNLCSEGTRCLLTYNKIKDNRYELTVERIPRMDTDKSKAILMTVCCLGFCRLLDRVTVVLDDPETIWTINKENAIMFDAVRMSDDQDGDSVVVFYLDDQVVASIKDGVYIFNKPSEIINDGEVVRMARVTFGRVDKTYDYICDLDEVKEGDTVVVQGYDGETEATVVDVFKKPVSMLPYPLDRYKKIIRKV
ncbi:MAG: sel1 repeat family protein [Lachnospiraceae bacterium]|nr:sel1 repeat family protein [Lachnospiraceae bacterium]